MYYLIWCTVFLIACTIMDLKEKKIVVNYCLVMSVFVIISHFITKDLKWYEIAVGMGIGLLFFIISKLSKEAIGHGDALMIYTIGCIVGACRTIEILLIAFGVCVVTALISILIKKKTFRSSVPFAPYLLIGTLCCLFV